MSTGFPRTRHLELSLEPSENGDPLSSARADAAEARGKAEGAQALIVEAAALPPFPSPERAAPPAGERAASPADKNEKNAKPEIAAPRLPRAGELQLWKARGSDDACLDEDGNRAGGANPILCPSSPRGRLEVLRAAQEAAQRSDAILLSGIDRWYALDHGETGFCDHCERALVDAIRLSYGEQVLPFAPMAALRHAGATPETRPFSGMRHATRLAEPLGLVRMAALAARDAARKARGAEISVLARASRLDALSLMSARHLDGLIIQLRSTDPFEALLPLLCARAAMGERAAIAELPANATPDQVRQLAALATACDADALLPQGASSEAQAALAAHRKFAALLRERFRPAVPLADVDLLIAARADHASRGSHLRASNAVAASLAKSQLQLAVRLDAPAKEREGSKLLVLAGAEKMPELLAPPLRRHVESGGDLLLIGKCERIDDEGRLLGPLFPEARAGLERVGEGRVFSISATPDMPDAATAAPAYAAWLEPLLQKALRELLGRTPRALSLSGRGQLWARAYLDPERKLDVHLLNLDLRESGFGSAQGMLLQIAGAAAGGGRTGYWFAPDRGGKEGDRIALNPSGFSVSTVLPAVGAHALLSVPR